MIRVLLVDDQTLIRLALKVYLEVDPTLEVVGEAVDGATAIAQVTALQPDVVLMDIQMPVMDGVTATREICEQFPNTQVLMLTIEDDDKGLFQALQCGAAGYLLKNTPPEELAMAIRAVHKGYTYLGPGLGKRIVAQLPDLTAADRLARWAELTPREQEILELIANGSNNREIAQTLYISEKTVKKHVSSILSRLNLRDRTQAAIFANAHLG